MEPPQVFSYEEDDVEERAAAELSGVTSLLGIEAPHVVLSQHGRELARRLAAVGRDQPPADADQEWAVDLGSRARRGGADGIIAIGGGRCLDVAKLAAARAGLPLVVAPTQLSHDGICSPVAVVPRGGGTCGESLGAIAPKAVFFSLPTLARAPADRARAGVGDLIANPLALRDWSLAIERGLEERVQVAWDMSVQAFELITPYLDGVPEVFDRDFLRRLADALVLSGMAMIEAGSSRPASGAEHEISHALDALYGGRALHGMQVAFGCILSVALYDEDVTAFRGRLERLGLPHRPEDLGLTRADVVKVVLEAPETRPGRFTILEDTILDEAAARRLVNRIWGE